MKRVGVVVIGRNEGERLRRCLHSLRDSGICVVYVDSGSTDGSAAWARAHGVTVVALDMRSPFTAARARNAGFEQLDDLCPELELVQFVDGDCEVVAGWIERAAAALRRNVGVAAVCGRRRERHPDRSIYNRLCDIEWDTPVGPATSCGGDAMYRASAFRGAGGFNPALIAGEEPELCHRLRHAGWAIERLDAEMTLHDAAITTFAQWWKRAVRSGHAYAERAALHARSPDRPWVRQNLSIFSSGFLVPAVALGAAIPTLGGALLIPATVYSTQTVRSYLLGVRAGLTPRLAWMWALSCVIAKFPQVQGQFTYWYARVRRRQTTIIEYKGTE